MKINFVTTIVAVCLALFLAWGYYAMTSVEEDKLVVAIVAGIEFAVLNFGMMGMSFPEAPRSGVMIRTACGLAFAIGLILNGIYAFVGTNASFFILNGLLLLLTFLAAYGIYKAKQ